MDRARAHRSQKTSIDCTRSGPAIFDTYGIFERDQRMIARTPRRQFKYPNATKPALVATAAKRHPARVSWLLEEPAVLPPSETPFVP